MKWWKYSGLFLILSGAGHLIIGWVFGLERLISFANGHMTTHSQYVPESTAFFWYCVTGILVVMLGHVCHYFIQRTQAPLPEFMGWYIAVTGIVLGGLMPISAVWVFIPQGILIIVVNRKRSIN